GLVVTAAEDRVVRLWDAASRKEVRRQEGVQGRVGAVAYSPDGRTILTGGWDGVAQLWDAATGKQARRVQAHTDRISAVAFSPDGRTFLTAGWDHTARLWDAVTGKQVGSLRMEDRPREARVPRDRAHQGRVL